MEKNKKKVIVAGHICVDITPVFPEKNTANLSEVFLPGKLIEMGAADVHTGGAVANTGLAMKKFGAEVSLMGKVGTDAFGDMIYHMLKGYRAESGLIRAKGESTSYSVVLAVPGMDRIFLHNPGANNTFSSSDIREEELRDAVLFHFGYPPLMRKMYENTGEDLLHMMKKVQDAGVATSLDMAAVDADSEAGKADWNGILKKVLPFVDFFVPSIEELCFMLDRDRLKNWQKRAGARDITEILDLETDIKPLANQCMNYGVKVLLIKCGAKGIYYRTADNAAISSVCDRLKRNTSEWCDREGFEKSYVPDRVLSGTGAGDTSIAAFLAAVLEGYSLEEALHLATATGACCVASYDALSGLQSFEELWQRIDSGWKKNS